MEVKAHYRECLKIFVRHSSSNKNSFLIPRPFKSYYRRLNRPSFGFKPPLLGGLVSEPAHAPATYLSCVFVCPDPFALLAMFAFSVVQNI